jgi:hypothetical protein
VRKELALDCVHIPLLLNTALLAVKVFETVIVSDNTFPNAPPADGAQEALIAKEDVPNKDPVCGPLNELVT